VASDNYEIFWEPTFELSLTRIGLSLEMFERLGRDGVALLLGHDPFESKSTFEISGTGHRYVSTRFRWPDLPAMLIAYIADPVARVVTIKGAEQIWDDDELVPEDL
jgi:hypothetical protein